MANGRKSSHEIRYTTKGQQRRKTPKMLAFESYYNDPHSPTFCNARGSAIRAGYSESYANNLTVQSPDWMTADAKRAQMLQKAEENLQKIVNMDMEELQRNPQLFKTWQDTVKFISERLGKEFYSTRQELTGSKGMQLFTSEHAEQAEHALAQLLHSDTDK